MDVVSKFGENGYCMLIQDEKSFHINGKIKEEFIDGSID